MRPIIARLRQNGGESAHKATIAFEQVQKNTMMMINIT
jgi:hypothetical protein